MLAMKAFRAVGRLAEKPMKEYVSGLPSCGLNLVNVGPWSAKTSGQRGSF